MSTDRSTARLGVRPGSLAAITYFIHLTYNKLRVSSVVYLGRIAFIIFLQGFLRKRLGLLDICAAITGKQFL